MTKGDETFATLIGRLVAVYAAALSRGEYREVGLLETQIADLERKAIIRHSWQATGG